uniref:Uncharacterized protein n=1 Tax=Avena sativa TaxID=4498 RepID=A0ACD5Z3E0_AVESA
MDRGDGGAGMGGPRGVVPSSAAAAAMLGMEMHLSHPLQPQMHANSAFQQPEHHHGGAGGFQHHQPVPPYSPSPYAAAPSRAVKAGGHEEEQMGNGAGNGGGAVQQPGTVGCPWSRMKWTDGMVRLLITVVYNAGDDGEGVSVGGRTASSHGKAGTSAHGHAGHGQQAAAQQKKGKWKSVSRAMMENGFMVSPQQCEDKFNDLNKRYKRVVDLLGRGKACRVVENPALLDGMDELTPRAKEEARKLLSSKHLFFREMCTYHNPGAAAAASHGTDEGAACFHHPRPASVPCATTLSAAGHVAAAPSPAMVHSSRRAAGDDDDDSEDVPSSNEVEEDDDDDLDDEEEQAPGSKRRGGHIDDSNRFNHQHNNGYHKRRRDESSAMAAGDDEEEAGNKRARRRTRVREEGPSAVQQLQSELAAVMAAGSDQQQMRQWMRRRAVELEEQQVAYDCREYQLQRQRLKWERFRANKERDMERTRLRNDRLRIDGRHMLLMLRQKDLDMDLAEANYSSSIDHHTGAQTPPLAAFHQLLGSRPSTAGHPN